MHIHSEDIISDCGLWSQNFGLALARSAGPIRPPLQYTYQLTQTYTQTLTDTYTQLP